MVGEDERAQGLAAGALVEDTRLRDALRSLLDPAAGRYAPDRGGPPLELPTPSIVDDALFAVDAAVLGDADEIRLRRGLDELDRRQKSVERLLVVRLERRIRAIFRGDRP